MFIHYELYVCLFDRSNDLAFHQHQNDWFNVLTHIALIHIRQRNAEKKGERTMFIHCTNEKYHHNHTDKQQTSKYSNLSFSFSSSSCDSFDFIFLRFLYFIWRCYASFAITPSLAKTTQVQNVCFATIAHSKYHHANDNCSSLFYHSLFLSLSLWLCFGFVTMCMSNSHVLRLFAGIVCISI